MNSQAEAARNAIHGEGGRSTEGASWKQEGVASRYLDERRGAIPYLSMQLETLVRVVRYFRPQPRTVADLGCGDGFLAGFLMREFPELQGILIDHSQPMLRRAEAAMKPLAGRYRLVEGDLAQPLSLWLKPGEADLIVSSFAIHHLSHARKRSLYEEIFELLPPGGMFLNLEHVASPTPELERLWEESHIEGIVRLTGRPLEEVREEYLNRGDRADNLLAPVELQLGWLREIGFQQVDCYSKFLEHALFGGLKGAVSCQG